MINYNYLLGKLNCMRDVFVGTCTLAYDFVAFNSIPSNCTGIYFPIIKKKYSAYCVIIKRLN